MPRFHWRQEPTGKFGVRPVWLLVVVSLWVAAACNLALWRELGRIPALDNARGLVLRWRLA